MDWNVVIGLIALLFALICFGLFVREAMRPAVPDAVVDKAAARAEAANLNPAAIGALAKALAEAFSKVGPAALGLIGALLFLLLAGEALGTYHLTDEKPSATDSTGKGKDGVKGPRGPDAGNRSSEAGNEARNGQ